MRERERELRRESVREKERSKINQINNDDDDDETSFKKEIKSNLDKFFRLSRISIFNLVSGRWRNLAIRLPSSE